MLRYDGFLLSGARVALAGLAHPKPSRSPSLPPPALELCTRGKRATKVLVRRKPSLRIAPLVITTAASAHDLYDFASALSAACAPPRRYACRGGPRARRPRSRPSSLTVEIWPETRADSSTSTSCACSPAAEKCTCPHPVLVGVRVLADCRYRLWTPLGRRLRVHRERGLQAQHKITRYRRL